MIMNAWTTPQGRCGDAIAGCTREVDAAIDIIRGCLKHRPTWANAKATCARRVASYAEYIRLASTFRAEAEAEGWPIFAPIPEPFSQYTDARQAIAEALDIINERN